jgi:homoserine kinase
MLRALQINPMWKLAVAVPELPEQIEKARKVLPAMVPLSSAVANMGRGFLLVHALLLGDVQPFRDFLEDQLHEPFRKTLIPGFESVKTAALEAGAAGVFISGSGSAVAAFVSSGVHSVADRMVEAFAGEGLNALPLALSVDRRGYQVERA